jgi:hypothetical protein
MNELFMRQSSCAPNFNPCNNDNFPDYFCCKSGQRCIALAGETTVLCCPEGSDCLKIQPIPCDISLQNGEKHGDAVVKTTALGGTLVGCKGQCCPFGYSCSSGECVMDKNQNAAPIQTNSGKPGPTRTGAAGGGPISTGDTSSPTDGPDTTGGASDGSSNGSSDGSSEGSSENESGESGESSGPPVAAIAGGVTAAVVVLLGAAVFAFIFLRKKKKKEESQSGSPPKLSRSTSSFGNLISNPIVGDNTQFRNDFARAPGPRDPMNEPDSVTGALIDSSVNSPETGAMLAVPPAAAQMGGQQHAMGYGGYGNLDAAAYQQAPYVDMPYVDHDNGLMPQTPRQHREPSSVSNNVFADPNITPDRTPESNNDRRYTNMTTFTQMLDNADLGGVARGESYLPYTPNGGLAPPMPRR